VLPHGVAHLGVPVIHPVVRLARRRVTSAVPVELSRVSAHSRDAREPTMEDRPAGQDVGVGSVSAFIEVLHEPGLNDQLPPCPDWSDLN